jgi:hypothetical protein
MSSASQIQIIDPPELGFFSKLLWCHGMPIKSHRCVSDQALVAAYQYVDRIVASIPDIIQNAVDEGAEMHVVGVDQQMSDCPEYLAYKGRSYEGKATIDERCRGVANRTVLVCEENLLKMAACVSFSPCCCCCCFNPIA